MARLVLSDTGPMIALARVDGLGWLRELFGVVALTPEVVAEIFAGKGGNDEVLVRQALAGGWLKPLGASPAEPRYPHLGEGEASCLRVALMRGEPSLLLLDDRLARREARRAGLKFVGVAAVIGMAELQGRTPSARAVIDQLLQTDYRVSQSVIDDVLRSLAADKARAVGN